ncbi:hypothetical protein WN943_011538 [Citrus x changshan-huyou]
MSINFSMGISREDGFDKKEKQVILIDERQSRGVNVMEHELLELEFWPVEHPLEPQDEDRPVKCPMPSASSVINNDSRMEDQERIADSFRKRTEVPPDFSNREGIDVNIEPPIRAVRKRHHHSLTSDDHNAQSLMRTPPHPPLQSQKITVLEMLQDFDKFES